MGGSGGGGGGRRGRGSGGAGGGPRQRPPDSCEQLRFPTALMSPQPATAALTVGEVLELRLGQQQGRPIVQVFNSAGMLVGTITHVQITQLIDCMQRGHQFDADVTGRQGGTCRVTVHHR